MAINSKYKVNSGGEAVAAARLWFGTWYCWGGGHGPSDARPGSICVDCSGLVDQVYGGPTTGSTTFTQVAMGTKVASLDQAGPGDLILFGPIAQGEPHHVGIYVGNNQMIDAPTTGVQVNQRSIAGYGPINAIRRLVPTSGGGTSDGTAPAQTTFNYAQLEGIWVLASGNAQYAAMAAAIATAESGGNSQAVSPTNSNGSVDRGLWQINSVHGSQSSLDIMTNARAAVAISNNGTNWRPWCTAWSNGACGGTYLGAGAPYQKYLQANVAPDMNVANLINGTNATTPGAGTNATTVAATDCSGADWFFNGFGCIDQAITGGFVSSTVGEAVKLVIRSILQPLIQDIVGIWGIGAGAIMVLFGIFLLFRQTDVGRASTGAAMSLGATALGAPEVGAAFKATPRPIRAYAAGQARQQRLTASQQRFAERSEMIGQRQVAVEGVRGQRQQETIAARTAGQMTTLGERGRQQRGVIRTRTSGQLRVINAKTAAHRERAETTTEHQRVRTQINNQAREHAARTRGRVRP